MSKSIISPFGSIAVIYPFYISPPCAENDYFVFPYLSARYGEIPLSDIYIILSQSP